MYRPGIRAPTPLHPQVTPGRIALSDSEKAEKLADSLETHFQSVNDPSEPAVIVTVDKALQAQTFAPSSETKVNKPSRSRMPSGEGTRTKIYQIGL
jgi:hypothetical protein